MAKKSPAQERCPLILRFHRLMDAFAKSDDERDFYLNLVEGFIIFADLDKNLEDLDLLERELTEHAERYLKIPKMTFYETKKFMEGFVNEKVYDIDTKEKLFDIIGSKEARENFLEFIYDHPLEPEKWQQYYYERVRIHIIEWLRKHSISFVFEEDLDIAKPILEKVKQHFFDTQFPKDVQQARNTIITKSKIYYSNEALNPRPKRGRPPKQTTKVEIEPQYTADIYKTVPSVARPYLFTPDFSSTSVAFSAKFDTKAQLLANLRGSQNVKLDSQLQLLAQRLESLCHLSNRLMATKNLDLENEEKLIQAVSTHSFTPSEFKKEKIVDIAKGFLPKKRGRPPKEKQEIQEFLKKKRKTKVKQVTQIKRPSKNTRKKEK